MSAHSTPPRDRASSRLSKMMNSLRLAPDHFPPWMAAVSIMMDVLLRAHVGVIDRCTTPEDFWDFLVPAMRSGRAGDLLRGAGNRQVRMAYWQCCVFWAWVSHSANVMCDWTWVGYSW